MGQLNLFGSNEKDGGELRDEAIDRVEENAKKEWMAAAQSAVFEVAKTCDEFTTDQVWKRIPKGLKTHEPRAMGAVMRQLMLDGVIVRTDRTKISERSACHARPVRVWRSLIR